MRGTIEENLDELLEAETSLTFWRMWKKQGVANCEKSVEDATIMRRKRREDFLGLLAKTFPDFDFNKVLGDE